VVLRDLVAWALVRLLLRWIVHPLFYTKCLKGNLGPRLVRAGTNDPQAYNDQLKRLDLRRSLSFGPGRITFSPLTMNSSRIFKNCVSWVRS
jgi:hypothetical protein